MDVTTVAVLDDYQGRAAGSRLYSDPPLGAAQRHRRADHVLLPPRLAPAVHQGFQLAWHGLRQHRVHWYLSRIQRLGIWC